MANKDPNILRKNVIHRWRRKKNLCLNCGQDPHEGECDAVWVKSDMREPSEKKEVNIDKKKETILNYRKKKLLCLRCGQMVHAGPCEENYDQSDMRSLTEKQGDPRTVLTPKKKEVVTLEKVTTNINLEKRNDMKYNRPYVFVDVQSHMDGYRIDFNCLRYLTKKYNDFIVCVFGDIERIYPYAQVLLLKRIANLHHVSTKIGPQLIVDHLWGCHTFISYKSNYTSYCKINGINCVEIRTKDNVKNVLMRLPKPKE